MLQPGLETNFIVHASQERIVRVALVNQLVVHHLIVDLLLCVDTVEDPILGGKLDDLVFAVHSGRPVLALHATVQQLVEVDVTVIAADRHFEHVSLLILYFDVDCEAQRRLPRALLTKLSEKLVQLAFFNELAIVSLLGKLSPYFHEVTEVILELFQIAVFSVVFFEVLSDNQNE